MARRFVKTHEGGHQSPANKLVPDGVPELTRMVARSVDFNLDNGAGTTVDTVLMRPSAAIKILAARIVYSDATSGTVAAGNVKLGTAVAGAEIVAATAYENTKAVGTQTALVLVTPDVAAGQPIHVRHTGVASAQAGLAYVEIEYMFA